MGKIMTTQTKQIHMSPHEKLWSVIHDIPKHKN